VPLIVDCDPGIDDAITLFVALASPELDVRAVTVVSGNVPVEASLANALRVVERSVRPDVPVHAGCFRPLVRAPIRGQFSGVGGLGKSSLPPPAKAAAARHAVPFLVETLIAAGRAGAPLTLAALGPLTNVAAALRHGPEVAAGIARIVLMGGAYREAGNRTMAAEFNILADPHAAEIVFGSGLPIVALGLDATHQAIATPARVAAIRAAGGPVATLIGDLLSFWDRKDPARYGSEGGPLHDPLVVAWLLRPDLFGSRRAAVFVQHESEIAMGQTLADWWGKTDRPATVDIVDRVDADGVFALITDRLGPTFQRSAA
jgi:purine nucleosidase